ncbi:hypothetical protein GKZ68_00600 [Hymenobacter sp. BRD128]|uniref:hypothetical protein n=1 Tax=Hymenobacter sp. BRD128 TaxID=2675878 RepID=UPI001567C017|nr:hypothetical protein [Hymenobacter sp. BRD128]QKG55265.1 hypothetical protein GKZ68_00600 [Hymenobacter sp. BRD128]
MPFVSFKNEHNSPHLNVDHIVRLELVTVPSNLPAVNIFTTRPEADLTVEFATPAEAQDLIESIIAYSTKSPAAPFELLSPAGAKPKLLAFARFEAGKPYEPGEVVLGD